MGMSEGMKREKRIYQMYCPRCGIVYAKDAPQDAKRGVGLFICVFCYNLFDKEKDHFLVPMPKPSSPPPHLEARSE
jgi:hypothetical protein